jgi:hypothetical protein
MEAVGGIQEGMINSAWHYPQLEKSLAEVIPRRTFLILRQGP